MDMGSEYCVFEYSYVCIALVCDAMRRMHWCQLGLDFKNEVVHELSSLIDTSFVRSCSCMLEAHARLHFNQTLAPSRL